MSDDISSSSVMADINVTPLVDVMLVLLIIFMLVTPALLAGFQATMPEGVHMKARKDDPERTTFGIDANGNYYLNKQPIAKRDAESLLQAEFKRHPDDKVLFVKADKRVPYGDMLELMNIAKRSGAFVIAAVSECRKGAQCSQDAVDDRVTQIAQ